MERREVLTQDEIDALIDGVGAGDLDSEVIEDAGVEVVEAQTYDLASQDRVVRGRLPTLELINEKFARYFRGNLYNMLRQPAEIGVGGIQILKYSEYMQTLFVPTSISMVRVKPMSGIGMFVIDAKLVFKLVDHFFGGDGRQGKTEGRDFTPTETRIVKRVLENVFTDMTEAWRNVMPVEFELLGSEVNPSLVNAVAGNEIMVVNTFQVELESGGGEIHFTLPYAALEPFRERLENAGQGKGSERDRQWTPSLEARLLDADVRIDCTVAERELTLVDILRLSVGDVIPVDMPEEHVVYANDVPAFVAKLGDSRGALALEIQDPYAPF